MNARRRRGTLGRIPPAGRLWSTTNLRRARGHCRKPGARGAISPGRGTGESVDYGRAQLRGVLKTPRTANSHTKKLKRSTEKVKPRINENHAKMLEVVSFISLAFRATVHHQMKRVRKSVSFTQAGSKEFYMRSHLAFVL